MTKPSTYARPTPGAQLSTRPSTNLSLGQIKKLIIDGNPGGWKFVNGGSGPLKAGYNVRVGSDYSGHCMKYKSQNIGINIGHSSDCGANIKFDTRPGHYKGRTIRYGEKVAMFMSGNGNKGFVCYGERDNGINLNWGENSIRCRAHKGANGHGAVQWKIMPSSGSSKKVGDPVSMQDRIVLQNLRSNQPVVKCARLNGLFTFRAGDLKWKKDCKRYELLWTHRELLEKLGENPKKLVYDAVPASLRKYLKYVPGL